jgi:GTPase SAR1 family protein
MDRAEIRAQLCELPLEASIALALRAGLRVLPWLTLTQGKTLRSEAAPSEYLLSVFQSYEIGLLAVWDRSPNFRTVARARRAYTGADPVSAVDHAAAYVAAFVADAACANANTATFLTTNTSEYADAAATAYATAYANGIIEDYDFNLNNDVKQLRNECKNNLLLIPLWANGPSPKWEEQVSRFQSTVRSLATGFDNWLDWYAARCRGDEIDVDTLKARVFLPQAITSQSPQSINAYLSSLTQIPLITTITGSATMPGASTMPANAVILSALPVAGPLNRVRTIFIGDGEVGKTSLIRVLHGEPVLEGIEPQTPGIAIREWPIPDTPIIASFWDFGGQIMVHATHQLFLRESCLYVLLVSAREKEKATERAEYWLEHVKSFGKGAPVLIVANKADKEPVRLDEALLLAKYPDMIQGFFQLSATEAQGAFLSQFEQFKQVFCQQLQAVGLHQVQFQKAHFAVLQNLRQRTPKQAFLTHADYAALCNEQRIDEHVALNSAWLLDILDKLGVIVHFPDMVETEEYILNPRWLTYGVYTIMYHEVARITRADAVKLLGSKPVIDHDGNELAYPPAKCRIVFEAMRRYKLCYFLPRDPDQMIIPALLPSDIKQHGFDTASALEFHYQFESFLPRHLISELIVECHEDIANNDDQDIVWQHGVLLENRTHQTRALIQADYHFRRLSIWLTRGSNTADLLATLRDRVERIVARIDIKYKRNIRLPREALEPGSSIPLEAESANFGQILAMRNRNQPTYFHESGSEYSITKILGLFESKTGDTIINNNPTFNQNTTNIIKSKVGGNAVTSNEVKDSFNGLPPPQS